MSKLKPVLAGVLAIASACAFATESKVEHLNSGKGGFPFSEAVRVDGMLYLSGQLGLQADSGALVAGGIEPESHQTMRNIQAALERQGYGMRDVVKCTVFLADMADWPAFNVIYKSYFDAARYPARSALGVSGLALNAKVEVECMAAR